MRSKTESILLGMLWMLACVLGISFWFNTKFGFNIFSAAHWNYLAYLQAAQTPVRMIFYVSMVLSVIIMIWGLYILMRPRRRKIKLALSGERPRADNKTAAPNAPTNTTTATESPATAKPITAPAGATPAMSGTTPPRPNVTRPPHLTLPPRGGYDAATHPQRTTSATFVSDAPKPSDADADELRKIFTDAGYIVKKNPQIGALRTGLFAIGTNEVLWIGASNISTRELRTAMDKLQNIFTDTLDDIKINMNGFVINATDADTSEFQDILMFASTNALREYMTGHRNTPPGEDDAGNFDAYSAYMGTVIDYVGNI